MQKTLKWSPAQPQRKADNIISSKARSSGDVTGFTPSYAADKTENMRFIMSNEYMRMWYNERGTYEKNTYSKEQIIKEESKIKRRFVQRMMTYKKPNKFELLEQTIRKPVLGNEDSSVEPVDYRKLKYKPECLKHGQVQKGKVSSSKSTDRASNKPGKSALENSNRPIIFCPVKRSMCPPCNLGK